MKFVVGLVFELENRVVKILRIQNVKGGKRSAKKVLLHVDVKYKDQVVAKGTEMEFVKKGGEDYCTYLLEDMERQNRLGNIKYIKHEKVN